GKGGNSLLVPDGTSNTLMVTERYQLCNNQPCAWGYSGETDWAPLFAYTSFGKFQLMPSQDQCNPSLPQTSHRNGIQVAMCDGSARSVSPAITATTWQYATDPADGHPLGPDW